MQGNQTSGFWMTCPSGNGKKAVIFNLTIRFEQDQEKWRLYLPCIPHISESYKANDYEWEV